MTPSRGRIEDVLTPPTPSPEARPIAYIRRSVVSKNAPGDLSREFQTEAVRDLAGDDGDHLTILDGDWGRSGSRHETDKREAFADLLDSIKQGQVATVYAYGTDRLARSVLAAATLLDVCERSGVTIVTREGRYPPGDRAARSAFHLAAMMNEDYSSQASERQSSVMAVRRARGDELGPPPYGKRLAPREKGQPVTWEKDPARDPEAVLAAYREAGSFHGAARLLNQSGVPAPAGSRWYSGSVGRILHDNKQTRNVFEVRHTERRTKHGGSAAIFRRLLRCHCGGMLTPTRQQDGSFSYRCNAGYVEPITGFVGTRRRSVRPGHPDGITVSEKVVRAWAENESAKWDRLVIETRRDQTTGADPSELAERRRRAGRAFTMGALSEDELATELAEIDEALGAIADRTEAKRFLQLRRGVDWSAPPQDIAAACRRIWSAIHLGTDMRPTSADWRVRLPMTDDELADAL